MPADRATLTLAQCWLLLGDAAQAEALISKALTTRASLGSGRAPARRRPYLSARTVPDQVEEYLNQLDRSADVSPADKAWANRTRVALLLRKNRPADQDQALRWSSRT